MADLLCPLTQFRTVLQQEVALWFYTLPETFLFLLFDLCARWLLSSLGHEDYSLVPGWCAQVATSYHPLVPFGSSSAFVIHAVLYNSQMGKFFVNSPHNLVIQYKQKFIIKYVLTLASA